MTRRHRRENEEAENLFPGEVDDAAREAELYDDHGMERHPDPEQAELDRRESEGMRDYRENPAARREFVMDVGRTEHSDWQGEIRRAETAAGRREWDGSRGDYGIECSIEHPDGRRVRYDYVDLRSHQIVDRKPLRDGQSVNDVARHYAEQRRRHVEAYRARFHEDPSYHYSFYPSAADLDRDADE